MLTSRTIRLLGLVLLLLLLGWNVRAWRRGHPAPPPAVDADSRRIDPDLE